MDQLKSLPLCRESETEDPSATIRDSRIVGVVDRSQRLVLHSQRSEGDGVGTDRSGRVRAARRVAILQLNGVTQGLECLLIVRLRGGTLALRRRAGTRHNP